MIIFIAVFIVIGTSAFAGGLGLESFMKPQVLVGLFPDGRFNMTVYDRRVFYVVSSWETT